MNTAPPQPTIGPDAKLGDIIKLAIMAVGGQGGGVLTGWIETLARAQGYDCQATSVAGVAQRTGATIYYVEMTPQSQGNPVFSLAPTAGDVDILIAAEMMEAGRAIMRGFVTPDRTTLIASTHRALAVSEKSVPGDGIASSPEVRAAAEVAAQRLIMFDMEKLAVENGSAISASLFGALAGARVLPFSQADFEQAIHISGKGVEPSLRAFRAAVRAVQGESPTDGTTHADTLNFSPAGSAHLVSAWQELVGRVDAMPENVAEMALPGLRKVVDFQDVEYGRQYLRRLDMLLALDSAGQDFTFCREAAKYIANAMAYDDVMAVADRKTRASRMVRIRAEMLTESSQILNLTEFMHPRAEEIAGMMPARLGRWIEGKSTRMRRLDRLVNKDRRVRSDSLRGFLSLFLLAGLRRWRRWTLRHQIEMAHLDAWLGQATDNLGNDYPLAVEIIRCRRLIKGYSDTHARGLSKFDKVTGAVDLLAGRADSADWLRRLREAALQDEQGLALDGALKTIRSFA